MDVRVPPMLCRGRDMVIDGGLVFEGVPPLGVDVVDVVAFSCFVGDFVGDYVLLVSSIGSSKVKDTYSE